MNIRIIQGMEFVVEDILPHRNQQSTLIFGMAFGESYHLYSAKLMWNDLILWEFTEGKMFEKICDRLGLEFEVLLYKKLDKYFEVI